MTRLFLSAILLLLTFHSHAQKHYTFTVQSISTYPEAKPVISLLRTTFNTDVPRLFFPVFQADGHRFTANSEMPLTEQELRDVLAEEGYVLASFKMEESVNPENDTEKQ